MGAAPYRVFTKTDSIFFKGIRIYEDFDSTALFFLAGPGGKAGLFLGVRRDVSGAQWETMPTPSRITVSQVASQQPVDKISVSTVRYETDTYDRTFCLLYSQKHSAGAGDDLISYMNARSEGGFVRLAGIPIRQYLYGDLPEGFFGAAGEITGLLANTPRRL